MTEKQFKFIVGLPFFITYPLILGIGFIEMLGLND